MSTVATWPSQAESWLDERGKGAWIAAMVLGFIFVWPVGLAILFYMIWSKRMFSGSHATRNHLSRCRDRYAARSAVKSSGNIAFDAYKSQTLRRLEEEQQNFESFLQRLRESKDQSEFDDFMDDRARKASEAPDQEASDEDDGKSKDPKA